MMEDDFYRPSSNGTVPPIALGTVLWGTVVDFLTSPNVVLALFLGPFIIAILTRYMSGRPVGKGANKLVWRVPYWIPFIGHGFSFLWDPTKLMKEAREQSPHGVFSLYLGGTTHNIISDPNLVRSVMAQRESIVQFSPVAWRIIVKFFGIPEESKFKYDKAWEELNSTLGSLMRDPGLSELLGRTVKNMEKNVSEMITFVDTEIDLQPWEKFGNASLISDTETEIDLVALMRDMMGHASIPAMYGSAFLQKYPDLLHEIYDMDKGIMYFFLGVPALAPFPASIKARIARSNIWGALDDQQRALDAHAEGKHVDSAWGDMEDISVFARKRNEIYRKYGFKIRERGELSILWALAVNSSLLVYWQILYIFSTPGLVERLREEIAPYANVTQPVSIGKISEAPRLKISADDLSKNCPLLKATYFEALRLTDQPWSVRTLAGDVVISEENGSEKPKEGYLLREGEFITLPHDMHMKDPVYFLDPDKFEPERFMTRDDQGKVTVDMGTIRPYGGGPSLCKGRILAERECLALIAGILAFWDIEPAENKKNWVIPPQQKTTAVSRPMHETRVRIRRRVFNWEKQNKSEKTL
ncbi:cytochrome P450 [Amylocarpus encephaloides]|uniref:Cytochrome P450 n=1 Tax=Amylocarpus encephaloides TaxID=45428 RepID=A0A9P8C1X0_9HELO|nr:cytochrome P450 [Amylocarpus encephaloides]